MKPLTKANLHSVMLALSATTTEMREQEMFDEADTLEEVLPYLARLLDSDILPDPPSEEEAITGNMETLRDLCVQMRDAGLRVLSLKTQTTEARIPFDDLRLNKVPTLMESLGVKTATFSGLGRVQTASDLYASTRKGQKENAMVWLRDCGLESLIKETYNASSLKAVFRGLIKEGTFPPEEIFAVTPFVRASIVKA